jgi:DNA-binding NarL/FixJ family response regulator
MKTVRVLLADDHALVRSGFEALLKDIDGVEVVAEAKDGHQALEIINEVQIDLVLMDISMPGLNGMDATSHIRKKHPEIKVIILSMHAIEEYVLQALKVGVHGYVLKDAEISELELAINSVMNGKIYLSPAVSRHVIDVYLSSVNGMVQQTDSNLPNQLTSRQREVLQLIAEGKSSKEIGLILKISHKTVNAHRLRIMESLGVHDIPGLVRYALRTGLISD